MERSEQRRRRIPKSTPGDDSQLVSSVSRKEKRKECHTRSASPTPTSNPATRGVPSFKLRLSCLRLCACTVAPSSSFSSKLSGAPSTTSTDLRIRPPGAKQRGSFLESMMESILETQLAPPELSTASVGDIHDYWHNYDIHKSLRPKLLPDEDFSRAQVLLYAFRISYAKIKKREIKAAKEQAIQVYYALKVQCAARQRAARTVRKRKEVEKERDTEERRKYNAFKQRLMEGIPLRIVDLKKHVLHECVAMVEPKEPKFLVVKGPKIPKAIKFDLMFLFKVHTGWTSKTIKEVPRELRGPKETSLSLEGKTVIDFVCPGTAEDAKYDREEFAMCFRHLLEEMNSAESIYRDAHGNRVRVLNSVFMPLSSVVLKGAKDNPVKLAGKNMASLYKIQHRFSKHKANIAKGNKGREAEKVKAEAGKTKVPVMMAGGTVGVDSRFEVESRPSTLSNLSLMSDELDYAEDPARWAKNSKKVGGIGERLAAREAAAAALEMSELEAEREAEKARQAITARRAKKPSLASTGEYDEDSDATADDDDDDDDDEVTLSDESDDELDDQASYTEYTETREEDGNKELLESDDEGDE